MTGLRFRIFPTYVDAPEREAGPVYEDVIAELRSMAEDYPTANLFEVVVGETHANVTRYDLMKDYGDGFNQLAWGFRARANRIYLHGSCWHYALVGHRLTGLDAVKVLDAAGEPLHVALVLPDGSFLDSRGVLETEHDLHRAIGTGDTRNSVLTTEPCPINWLEEVVKPERDDPELQLFLAETEAWFRLLTSMDADRIMPTEEPSHGLA